MEQAQAIKNVVLKYNTSQEGTLLDENSGDSLVDATEADATLESEIALLAPVGTPAARHDAMLERNQTERMRYDGNVPVLDSPADQTQIRRKKGHQVSKEAGASNQD